MYVDNFELIPQIQNPNKVTIKVKNSVNKVTIKGQIMSSTKVDINICPVKSGSHCCKVQFRSFYIIVQNKVCQKKPSMHIVV